jgi:hypothetical protein
MKSKFIIIFSALLFCALFISGVQAQDTTKTKDKQTQRAQHFVDKDGDGYNDNAPDHDGDGVPNCLDPDWWKLKKEKGKGKKLRFVDLDGDGINDNLQSSDQKKGENQKQMNDDGGSSIDSKQQEQKGQGQKKRGNKR